MSKNSPQTFKNHVRIDPSYHYFLLGILVINLVYAVIHLYRQRTISAEWFMVLSIAAFVFLFKLRLYPLKVQDRVIRLEERLRLEALAPAEWRPQILRLTEEQLIALRFAPDEEIVSLAKQALDENLGRDQIKERIQNWRPDTFRV
jgi:hypothetical protein